MPTIIEDAARLHNDLVKRAARYGIVVRLAQLDDEVPGEFDGPTITLNQEYDAAERAFYLAHAIGSIAEWSLHSDRTHQVMGELRQAEQQRGVDANRLERAVDAYLSFENRTWEFAVWLLEDSGHAALVPAFTNFGRADLEAMRIFHTTGEAPVWREFFAAWSADLRRGARSVSPFQSRPIPDFRAIQIPKQEIVQEEDGEE